MDEKEKGCLTNGNLHSYLRHLPSYIVIGPCPIHEVVVMAVRKAVRAATTTFTATSITRFVFIIPHFLIFSIPQFKELPSRATSLILVRLIVAVSAA